MFHKTQVKRLNTLVIAAASLLISGIAFAADDLSWIEKRIQDWQPTADERRIDRVGWVNNILEAERLAKAHGRPVFLFTFDGPNMASGRC